MEVESVDSSQLRAVETRKKAKAAAVVGGMAEEMGNIPMCLSGHLPNSLTTSMFPLYDFVYVLSRSTQTSLSFHLQI